MIKLFITDLDGTLLGMDHYIKQKDIDSFYLLMNHNVELAVATGRMEHEIAEVLRRMELKGHRISQNGAFVYGQDDLLIHSETFTKTTADHVIATIQDYPMVTTVSTATDTYTSEHNEWIDVINEQLFHDIIVKPSFVEEFGQTLHPSKFTLHGNEEDIAHTHEQVSNQFGETVDAFISHKNVIDIMPPSINKGNSILALLSHLRIRPDEIACVGDSFNDLPMFAVTPNSYVMSTAHPDVQAKANTVVDHVYEAIEDLDSKGML
ncbi:Cof-type HAD-IIB family hydrolase [Halobacillus amylolyticus]|uniref:HAD family hydrolase n=1 Tax=Halobacillus amylolyticus TaxID=2932259 RepID=A0ABY4HFB5_9BACI|nr:Cof-type HAD-IIB family hydrolase [Halobacillus amylolyticus]UOR13337.1 HAD family hydrolase [Halobacillus amylolyticus]